MQSVPNYFTCLCQPGYTGATCQTALSACASHPCQSGGTCLERITSYACICPDGYNGTNCQNAINYCTSNPCRNGALCMPISPTQIQCICQPGSTGTFCEIEIDVCSSYPCQNRGVCTRLNYNYYSCACYPGYTGTNCQIMFDTCSSSPCQNGASCVQPQANLFTCLCCPGFTGTLCETNLNDCNATSCQNGGTCIDLVNSFACKCPAGYYGATCALQINPCASGPCVYGTCQQISPTQYVCICQPGVTGINCQSYIDPCLSQPCLNRGTCVSYETSFTCQCPVGITGPTCGIIINNCASAPCLNGGTCTQPVIGNYQCACLTSYTGKRCEVKMSVCVPGLCQNGGTCLDSSSMLGYVCQCQAGYTGQLCQTNINECQSCPCFNKGTCYDLVNGYQCYCPAGYTGTRCEIEINDCSSMPCMTGQCVTQKPYGYMCVCPQGRMGARCETRLNECDSQPCKNGGECTQLNPFGFQCQCTPGYQGMFCEIAINPCDSSPCLNGGACSSSGTTSWQCSCKCGYTGSRCESVINECANNPCLNGGTCTQPKPCGFVCACPQEPVAYYGSLCENSFGLGSSDHMADRQHEVIHSAEHTLYFRQPTLNDMSFTQHQEFRSLAKLKFNDIKDNILTAYNTENINNRNVCPATFSLVGSACYKLLGDRTYEWHQAKTQCLLMSSHLAWFSNSQELDLVKAWLSSLVVNNDVWIGGKIEYGKWNWDLNNTAIHSSLLAESWGPGMPAESLAKSVMYMSRVDGFLFGNEIPDKDGMFALCRKSAFVFDQAVTHVNALDQIKAVDQHGNPLVGFQFVTNVTSMSDGETLDKVYSPSSNTFSVIFSQLPVEHGEFYSGPVFTYTSPYTIPICSDLTTSQIAQVKESIKRTWLNTRQDLASCNCFDIHIVAVDKFTTESSSASVPIITQISYIGKANRQIFEMTNSQDMLVPTQSEIFSQLRQIGFSQCSSRSKRSISLLDMAVASPTGLDKSDYDHLQQAIHDSVYAVRPDFVTNKKKVIVKIVSNRDVLDVNTHLAVTQIYLQVSVDGQLVDFYTQSEFDKAHLIDQLNYQNENNSIKVLNSSQLYAKNYFFMILSETRIRRVDYSLLERHILEIFLDNYADYRDKQNVSVSVTWQEEYLDENKDVLYGLSILISVNNQPVNNMLHLNRNIFDKLREIRVNDNQVYRLKLPNSLHNTNTTEYLHPLSKALTFYSNILVCKRDYNKIERLIHASIGQLKPDLKSDLLVVLAHQKEMMGNNGTHYWKIFMLATRRSDNSLIDIRLDAPDITELAQTKMNFLSSNGDEYKFHASLGDAVIIDSSYQFNVFIEGKINEAHKPALCQAIVYTWNLTAYQTKNFVDYFLKNYHFTFMPDVSLEVDVEGKLQTKIVYFVSSANKYANEEDFDLLPNVNWLQDSIVKYDLPYSLVDGNDGSTIEYDKLYFVDFDGYIDPLFESDISSKILSIFRRVYYDVKFIDLTITMKEKRIGEWGNNVTRLLYYLEDFNDNVINSYEYKPPVKEIHVS